MQTARKCNTCKGRGLTPNVSGTNWQTCPTCEGAGAVQPTPARVPRWYPLQVIVPLNGQNSGNVQIGVDADFEWIFTMYQSTSALLSVSVQDGSSGKALTVSGGALVSVPIALFAGTAQLPFPLLEPYIIARSSTVNFQFSDSSGAQNTVTIVLMGNALFPQDAQEQGSAGMIASPASS
jgi:hypothetical protein